MKEITLDSSKTLKLADKKQELSCDTHSELLLIQASQRRALALDLVGVASYAEVEKYNTFLTMHLQTPAPPGYGKISVSQIVQADRHAWLRLAEKLTQGIRRRPDNSLPMGRALNELEADPRVSFNLLPSPPIDSKRHQADPEPVVTNPNKFHKGGKGKKGKGKEFASVPKKST